MHKKPKPVVGNSLSRLMTYITYFNLILLGHAEDLMGKILMPWKYAKYFTQNGIPAFFSLLDSFFIRKLYQRIADCFERPIIGFPAKKITILERTSNDYNKTFQLTVNEIPVLNVGSYNYLGFSSPGSRITDPIIKSVDELPLNYSTPIKDFNSNEVHQTLEREMADFIYQEDCAVFSMGFGTNTSTISILMRDSLIFSDEYNHTSLIKGMKLSESEIVLFNHNDMRDLEDKLKFHISQNHLNNSKSWKKIFVVIEGLFSMEGTIANLKKLVKLKRKYKFYIYLDEAHSIGAMGKTGRGVCEHLNIPHSEIDIHMGTFTKSFGGFGGYIAGSKKLINFIRKNNIFYNQQETMSPIVAQQILICLREIIKDTSRIKALRTNTRRLRDEFTNRGFYVIGDKDSAIVPILIPTPGKIGDFSRLCLARGLAVVVVGYPATPILLNRARLCVSSLHTNKDIDFIVHVIDEIGSVLGMKKLLK